MCRLALVAATVLVASVLTPAARAGEKQFGYVYEPQTLGPGAVELEQWVTPRLGKAGGIFSEFDLRSEIEVGLVENLQTSLYLNLDSVRATDARAGRRGSAFVMNDKGDHDFSEFSFHSVSNEWIYKFLDPVADPIGLAAYVEWETNGTEFEIEEKLLLAKTWGGLTLAMNLIFEQDFRSRGSEPTRAMKFSCAMGVAYKIPGTGLGFGLEFRNENQLDSFRDYDHSVFSIGPNVHYATSRWWTTLTVMPQIASANPTYKAFDYDAYEVVDVRLIVGVEF